MNDVLLTAEQAQQIDESLLRVEQSAEESEGDDGMVMVVPLDLYNELAESLETIRAARAQEPITTPDVCGEVCARAKLCYGCGKALDEANAKLSEQADHIAGADNMVCNWYQDDGDGIWATDCGGVFEIIEGSPSDNDMKFCPYCGKPLEEHPFVDSED